MGWLVAMVRRSIWLLLIGAVGGTAYAWWRDHSTPDPSGPPEWPPLAPPSPRSPVATSANRSAAATGTASNNAASTVTASFVNALVDAPEARSADGARGGWVDPDDDGACPVSHPIKANDNSGIFHVPDGRFYDRTKAERCYQSADAATADGYRQAKN